MSADFQTIIRDLWTSLKLPAPVFRESGSIHLQIDAHDLTLSETPDGLNVQISGVVGPLARDLYVQQRQVKMLLEESLVQLLIDETCVVLRPGAADGRAVAILGLHPCVKGQTDGLIRRIEMVLARMESLAVRLDGGAEKMLQPLPRGGMQHGDEMILRP